MAFYNEIANIPLFVWDPRYKVRGERRKSLVQTIDLPATILEYFGIALPKDMEGVPLKDVVASDKRIHEGGLFGVHGGHVNVTDGRYVYMRGPANKSNTPQFNYTLMPTHMRGMFRIDELADWRTAGPFSFTKGLKTLKTPSTAWVDENELRTMLFDIDNDPKQQNPLNDKKIESRMTKLLVKLMKKNDAPKEQYERLGLRG